MTRTDFLKRWAVGVLAVCLLIVFVVVLLGFILLAWRVPLIGVPLVILVLGAGFAALDWED